MAPHFTLSKSQTLPVLYRVLLIPPIDLFCFPTGSLAALLTHQTHSYTGRAFLCTCCFPLSRALFPLHFKLLALPLLQVSFSHKCLLPSRALRTVPSHSHYIKTLCTTLDLDVKSLSLLTFLHLLGPSQTHGIFSRPQASTRLVRHLGLIGNVGMSNFHSFCVSARG